MKITIDIDCSPAEAREYMGLPDVRPLHDLFMENMTEKMSSGLSADDMEKMFKLWMTPAFKGPDFMASSKDLGKNMEALQNMFWNAAKPKTDE